MYVEAADGNLEPESEVCACKPATTTTTEEEEPELVCAVISPVPERPCNTRDVFYRWPLSLFLQSVFRMLSFSV